MSAIVELGSIWIIDRATAEKLVEEGKIFECDVDHTQLDMAEFDMPVYHVTEPLNVQEIYVMIAATQKCKICGGRGRAGCYGPQEGKGRRKERRKAKRSERQKLKRNNFD